MSLHEKKVKKFYTNRYSLIGNKIQAVGWNSKSNQFLRFKNLLKNISLKNKSLLDYGCGFSDLILYLKSTKNYNINYSGYDLVSNFIEQNKKKFKLYKFYNNENFLKKKKYDYILCSGVFSLKTNGGKEYFAQKSLYLLNRCNKGLLLNFLSSNLKKKLSKNLYYTEAEVKKNFKNIKNIKIKIIKFYGLHEFTIQIIKI